MTQITRLYDSTRQLPSIESELKSNGYKYAVVTSAQPTTNDTSLDDSILAALGRAGVSRSELAACLDAIKRGGALVSVQASFGFGAKASALLDKFGPSKISATSTATVSDDDDCAAAPFSKMVRAPVLLDTSGEYKSYSGTPLLLDSKKFLSGTPLVLEGNKFFSGTPLLLDSSGPYRSFSGTPLLIDDKKFFSGTPLLLNNPTPLSTWLGLPVLLK